MRTLEEKLKKDLPRSDSETKGVIEYYERFFSLSQDMFCIAGVDGFFKRVNQSFERVLGYSKKELLEKPFVEFVHPDDVQKTLDETVKLSKGYPTVKFENRYQCKDGSYVWLSWTSSSAKEEELVYAVARDITESKRTEEQLRRNQAFLDSVVQNIPNMIFVKDASELRFVRFNKAGEELLGYSRNEMIGKNDYDFFTKKEADFFTQKDREVLQGKKLVDIPEEQIKTRCKGLRWLHTKKIPLYDQVGKPEYLLGISEDVTEQKKSEELLKENEQRLAEAQQIANVGSWEYNADTKKITWSDETYRLFGIAPQSKEVSLEDFRKLIHPDDRDTLTFKVNQAIQQGIPYEIEMRHIRPDGTIRYLSGRGRPVVKNGQVVKLIGTGIDITESKMAEKKIMKAVVEGQDMERRRIADDLHDSLGQKLSAIKINFASFERETRKLNPSTQTVFETIKEMLNEAVEEVRNISHNLMPSTLEDFGLDIALEDLCNKLDGTTGINVDFQTHGKMFNLSEIIRVGIFRIAQELLNNSLKHAQAKEINVQLFSRDDTVILSVEDDGIGFDINKGQLENTYGFNSIHSRVKALNGLFSVESKLGEGTLVSVEIPLEP